MTGTRSQNPEVRSQNPESRSQEPESRSQNPEARSQKSEVRSQKPGARSQEPEEVKEKHHEYRMPKEISRCARNDPSCFQSTYSRRRVRLPRAHFLISACEQKIHVPRRRGIQGVDNERKEEMGDPSILRDGEPNLSRNENG